MSKTLIGKFIRDEWNNGDFRQVWLRRIVAETKTAYVCHVQRYVKNWDKEPYEQVFVGRWAKRYRKVDNELGFRKVITHRSNPDGKSTLSLVEDFKTLKCEYTYKELFGTDVREFQGEEEYPRKGLEFRRKRDIERGSKLLKDDFFLGTYCVLQSSVQRNPKNPIMDWDFPITKYLEDMFGCPVYNCYESINEDYKISKLSKSGTLMHINHFGGDKTSISSEENYFNRTIMFWYFGDKLVFVYKSGMDTH